MYMVLLAHCYWSVGSFLLGMTSYSSKLIYSNSSQTQGRPSINEFESEIGMNRWKNFVEFRSAITLLLNRVERISSRCNDIVLDIISLRTHTLLSTACARVIVFILGCNSTHSMNCLSLHSHPTACYLVMGVVCVLITAWDRHGYKANEHENIIVHSIQEREK